MLCSLLLVVLLAGVPASAQSRSVTIASGGIGGTYRDVYAPRLAGFLSGYRVLHRSTSGSAENLAALASGEVQLAFAQADVYALLLASQPERYGALTVLGKLASECVYVAHRKEGRVKTLAQLSAAPGFGGDSRPVTVAVGPEGSGSRGTWSYLARIVSGLERAKVVPQADTLALNQLGAGAYDAVLWVTDPTNLDHRNLRAVVANDSLDVMPLDDPALVQSLPDGTEVYGAESVKLGSGWRAPELKTICTSSLVLAREDADPLLVKKAADAIALHRRKIVPETR